MYINISNPAPYLRRRITRYFHDNHRIFDANDVLRLKNRAAEDLFEVLAQVDDTLRDVALPTTDTYARVDLWFTEVGFKIVTLYHDLDDKWVRTSAVWGEDWRLKNRAARDLNEVLAVVAAVKQQVLDALADKE